MDDKEKSLLYTQYEKKIQYYLMSKGLSEEDAEDLCANIFLKFFKSVDEHYYNGKKSAATTYMYRITQNALIDFFRTRKVHGELDESYIYEDKSIDNLLTEETLSELGRAMLRLDARSNALVTLVYYDGKKIKEAAEILNMNYSNAKAVLKKALATIKTLMESEKPLRRR